MEILLLEPYYTSSHKQWVDGFIKNSNHRLDLISMKGVHWKWRMEHSAVFFADKIIKLQNPYNLIICNDLTNLAVLKGLLKSTGNSNEWYNHVPIYTYFHENQITYPWSAMDQDVKLNRDVHYGWINYLSCLAADKIIFNSYFHKSDFLTSLPGFLDQFPDDSSPQIINGIKNKSHVLHIGLDLKPLVKLEKTKNKKPIILWNHRWEYDKNPEIFFQILFDIMDEGLEFEIIVAGEKYNRYPKIFDIAKEKLKDRIIHFGYASSRVEYLKLLSQSDIIPVTSNQDFFGISAIEAIAAGCYPLLPDRLAFSEHLQLPNKTDYYYGTDKALKTKLINLIKNKTSTPVEIKNHVLKYDWHSLIGKYDAYFNLIK